MHNNSKIRRWDALWVALITLLDLNGFVTRFVEKRAILSLLDPSLTNSQAHKAFPPTTQSGHHGVCRPLKVFL